MIVVILKLFPWFVVRFCNTVKILVKQIKIFVVVVHPNLLLDINYSVSKQIDQQNRLADLYTFLGKCPPTSALSQHFARSETLVLILA